MKSVRILLLAAATMLAPAHAAEDTATLLPAVETTIASSISDTNRMTVGVTIRGGGPYPFIVDTAAERSVIARELADELQLQPAGRTRVLSMTASRDAGLVSVPDLSFAPGYKRSLPVLAFRGEHIGAAGVLGIDALRGQRVVLDFAEGVLRVGPAPRRDERFGPDVIVVRAQRRFGQLVLADVQIGATPVDVIVDSGTQVSLGNEPLRRLLTNRQSQFRQVTLLSITGETLTADYTRADRLRIGSALITNMPVAFANAHFFKRMKLTREPALLLGMDALRMFDRVTVDFPNRRATFVLPEDARRS